ncbi:HNH endonuclease [Bosea sp. LjRoot237]|uniref:HNH endonuclease n=1 Tax=Bosea sp. LjRoot237 TaxID=3342292 RepID=UPI003F507310
MCMAMEDITEADTVDHVKPHKGDEALFWDQDNLQSLCAACHNRHKQREERGTARPAFGVDGYPIQLCVAQ